jgi:hypothetical protein
MEVDLIGYPPESQWKGEILEMRMELSSSSQSIYISLPVENATYATYLRKTVVFDRHIGDFINASRCSGKLGDTNITVVIERYTAYGPPPKKCKMIYRFHDIMDRIENILHPIQM